MLNLACRNGHVAAHRLVKVTRRFTLFFIPLFPVSQRYFSVCAMCGMQLPWDKASAEAAAAEAANAAAKAGPTFRPDPVAPPIDTTSVATPPPQSPVGAVAAGWYPDPAGGAGLRYWDGAAWTQSVHNSQN